MTKSHSEEPDNPLVSWVRCDECGNIYEELAAIVWGRNNGIISLIYCIECDETALRIPDFFIPEIGKIPN